MEQHSFYCYLVETVCDTQNGVQHVLFSLGLKTDLHRLVHLKTLDINARDVKKDRFVTTDTINDVDERIHNMLHKLPLPRKALQGPA